eukprot:5898375-Pyramimonas_sp.AAC.1
MRLSSASMVGAEPRRLRLVMYGFLSRQILSISTSERSSVTDCRLRRVPSLETSRCSRSSCCASVADSGAA